MRRLITGIIACFGCVSVWAGATQAQGRNLADWMTSNGDAQRSSWVRADAKISREALQQPGFQLLWKLKLKNDPNQLNRLRPPVLLDLLIGYRGFRALGFVGGSSDKIFVIDTDLGRMEWEKRFPSIAPQPGKPATGGSPACSGGMIVDVTRPTIAALPPPSVGGGFGGRRSPARGGVGQPGEGAVTLAQLAAPRPAPPPSSPSGPAGPARPAPALPSIFGSGPFLVYALSGDGRLHTMHLSNGADAEPPVKFLPPNANAHGLIVVDRVAYAVTRGCGGAPNGIWALDLASKQVATWNADIAGSAGPAFDPDGTLYVTTGAGGESPFSLVALESKTLKVKGRYTADRQAFTSSPIVFEHGGKILIAATTDNGQVHLLDSASLNSGGGSDRQALLSKSAPNSKANSNAPGAPGALASWQDSDGTRWILAPVAGPLAPDAGFTGTNGQVTKGAIVAWKIAEQNGAPVLQPGWVSRDLVSPVPPTIINGVVFAVSGGEVGPDGRQVTAAQRARQSSRAILYALDAGTGKELWNSGSAITSSVRGGALSGGGGQFYLTTSDGMLYAFGFPMEH